MGRWSADRLAALTGIGFVVLFVVAFFVPTKPPDSTDPNSEWVAYVVHHHRSVLVSAVLFGAATMFLIWFSASLAQALRATGQTRLAAVAFGGGIATAGVGLALAGIEAGLAQGIALDAPASTKAVIDVWFGLGAMISFPIAVVIAATAIVSWRTGLFPRWWAWLSAAAAVLVVSGGATLAHGGFYRPDGPWAYVTVIVFLAWTAVMSAWLAWRTPAAAVPEVSPAL
jgi:hypothetical protein